MWATFRNPVILLVLILRCPPAAAAERPEPAPQYTEALGVALETWPYPYPVHFLPFEAEGQSLRMAYMDVRPEGGGADAPAVVLLHGKNFFGANWEGTIRALAGAGMRVIVPDQIGFGKSSKPTSTTASI